MTTVSRVSVCITMTTLRKCWNGYDEEKPWLPPGGNVTPAEQEERGSDLQDDWMRIWLENYQRLFFEH